VPNSNLLAFARLNSTIAPATGLPTASVTFPVSRADTSPSPFAGRVAGAVVGTVTGAVAATAAAAAIALTT